MRPVAGRIWPLDVAGLEERMLLTSPSTSVTRRRPERLHHRDGLDYLQWRAEVKQMHRKNVSARVQHWPGATQNATASANILAKAAGEAEPLEQLNFKVPRGTKLRIKRIALEQGGRSMQAVFLHMLDEYEARHRSRAE